MVARRKGQSPWYLLTSEIIYAPDDAWNIIHAYARRWQVELSFRYTKTGLAFESPRLVGWQERKKLLMIASLCYGFMLSLLHPDFEALRSFLLRYFCHRTGKWSWLTPAPFYR
ncbi:MAG: transposase [Anaerolineaceae bacterium]|nr:transposase [Anaerolineaceae bacterium]